MSSQEELRRTGMKPVPISLHMIVKRHLPLESASWPQDKIVDALNQLTHLRLDRENIRLIDSMELFSDRLTNIYLQENQIERIENLECLKNIQFLTLSSNKLRRVEGLSHLEKLVFLDLSNNFIKDLNPDELPESLAFLNLKGNPCTESPVYRRQLVRALPKLRQLDGDDITTAEKLEAGYEVSSDSEDDDDEEETRPGYRPEEIFSVTSGEMLMRSQNRMENSLLEHKEKRELLRDLRTTTAELVNEGGGHSSRPSLQY